MSRDLLREAIGRLVGAAELRQPYTLVGRGRFTNRKHRRCTITLTVPVDSKFEAQGFQIDNPKAAEQLVIGASYYVDFHPVSQPVEFVTGPKTATAA